MKFATPILSTSAVDEVDRRVAAKASRLRDVPMNHYTVSEQRVKRIIKKLRKGF